MRCAAASRARRALALPAQARRRRPRRHAARARARRASRRRGDGGAMATSSLRDYNRKRNFTRTAEPRGQLVRMKGRERGGKENWLLIKAEDEYGQASGSNDLLEAKPRSVKTRRTVEEVGTSNVKIRPKRSNGGVRPLTDGVRPPTAPSA